MADDRFKMAENIRRILKVGYLGPTSANWLNLSFELTLSWETGTRTVSPEFNSFVSTGPSSMFSI